MHCITKPFPLTRPLGGAPLPLHQGGDTEGVGKKDALTLPAELVLEVR
jgi:hypothetical protein